ncbi:TRAP-type mannitol/chloroaromatic compound transport system, substrate-binding protein [Nitratireductor aquibiodomus]|uniref:TRAP-type mannitol/chloroaromatic compound transport system, substrate-binding protein n=1 Tax=Nitratireductor aquibiodomus TaxID=204799 RepID=A0A1H4KFB9_9HYPH|nr:TRAP transporter substrate-binding protein DctP [Nitratireductor aquibiodomus]SEB56815.1 TRAP-type mannitol/chloroaromatic compound transport system, substrate-binding protein [Nitratireductor aquibiodomus]
MKRRSLLGTALTALALVMATLSSPVLAQDKINLRMATSWSGGYTMELMANAYAEEVARLTDGRITIETYPGGTLGSALEVSDLVRNGVADMGHTWMGYDWGEDRTTILFGGFAGSFDSERMLHWLYVGGGLELWREFRADKFDLVSMPLGIRTPEVFLHSNKPVRTLEDFQGLKLRTAGAWLEISSELGAAPVTAPMGEVYTMLERGVVDAVESGSLGENQTSGFHQVAKYVILPGAHQPVAPFELVISPRVWEGISEADRALLQDAARLVTLDCWMTFGQRDAMAKTFYEDEGNEVIDLASEVQKAIYQAGAAYAERNSQENEWFARVWQSQREFDALWQGAERYRKIER